MVLSKRYCVEYANGDIQCFRDDSFWYTDKGIIIKWVILAIFFLVFMGWFVGGYIHAKQRLKKGQPLLAYHRFLISYSERKRHGQAPQNHFTFYQTQNPYYSQQYPQQQQQQRQDGAFAEPPPLYNNHDAPPQYFAPPGASKANPSQGMEMPQYGGAQGSSQQQNGVVGSSSHADVEQGQRPSSPQELPPRPPQQAKAALRGVLDRFRK